MILAQLGNCHEFCKIRVCNKFLSAAFSLHKVDILLSINQKYTTYFEASELEMLQDNARLVRDVYAYFPILMKYTDLHRAQWLKTPSWETDGVYENVAVIFKVIFLAEIVTDPKFF